MAFLDDSGQVFSDNGEWRWNPEGGSIGGGSWKRVAPMSKPPGLMTRLLVKKSAWGKPGLNESLQAAKLQPTRADRKLAEIGDKLQTGVDRLQAEVDNRKANQ